MKKHHKKAKNEIIENTTKHLYSEVKIDNSKL